jgi:hypothetical protein
MSYSKERDTLKKQQLVESFKASTSGNHYINTEDNKNILFFQKLLNKFDDEIVLPRQTLYLIDKIIRKRLKNGKFGLEYGDEMLKELQWRKSKTSASDYSQRLEKEQRALDILHTPYKNRIVRATSAKKTANSAPNKKFESKIHERHRINRSEEKQKTFFDGINDYGLLHYDWSKRKEIEDRLRSFLIESETREVKQIMLQATQKVTELKKEKGDAHSIWLASKKKVNAELRSKKMEEKMKKKKMEDIQKRLAEESYKEWLRKSIFKQEIEDQVKADKRIKDRIIKNAKDDEDQKHKLNVKIALKEWDSYIDRKREDDKVQKKDKDDLIKRLEKAQRYKRKKEDEILCYPINLNKKKKKKPMLDPKPRKTKLI